MRTSDDLEIPLQLPVGDGPLELPRLPLARRGEVVHEGLPQPAPGHLAPPEESRRVPERGGELELLRQGVLERVAVSRDGLQRLQPLPPPPEPAPPRRRRH